MQRRHSLHGFTLAEMLVAISGSLVILGTLLVSTTGLQRALHSAELFSTRQADQRRLLDYVARDLRRAIAVASSTSVSGAAGVKLVGTTFTVDATNGLLLTVPGYYRSDASTSADYHRPLAVVAANHYVDYGDSAGHAKGVPVLYRQTYVGSERCVCITRSEGDAVSVILRQAEPFRLQVSVGEDGLTCTVLVTFASALGGMGGTATERETVLMRNLRLD